MKTIIIVILALIAFTSAHICKAEGDPHYRTFGGKGFNFYATGEFNFFHRNGFNCNTRLRQSNRYWRGRSLNVGVACKYHGVHFEIDVESSKIKSFLNHRSFSGSKTVRGIKVTYSGRNFEFNAGGMRLVGNINRIPSGSVAHYLNLYVYSHHAGASGLCQGQQTKARRTLFYHGKAPHFRIGHKRRISHKWKQFGRRVCARRFKIGSFSYRSCVTDVASSKRKRIARQYSRFKRVVKKKFTKVCKFGKCHFKNTRKLKKKLRKVARRFFKAHRTLKRKLKSTAGKIFAASRKFGLRKFGLRRRI